MEEITIKIDAALLENEDSSKKVTDFLIEELSSRLLTKKDKELLRLRSVRRGLLSKCGKDAFLLPSELKFPIVKPSEKTCNPDCALLFAAYLRANEWKKKNPEYAKVAEKAKELFMKNNCAKKIKVQIRENEEMFLEEFVELLES